MIQRGERRRGMRRARISVPGPSPRCVRWKNTCSPSSTTWSPRASWTVYRWSAGVGRYSGGAPGNKSSSTCTTASWSVAGCKVMNEGPTDNSLLFHSQDLQFKKNYVEEEFFLFTWGTCIFCLLLMQTDISVNWLPKSQEILPTQVFSYLLCLFFCDIYIKRIYFLTMCLIFSKFILFWFLTYFAGLAINTIGFHPEIVMILYTVCITSWCIELQIACNTVFVGLIKIFFIYCQFFLFNSSLSICSHIIKYRGTWKHPEKISKIFLKHNMSYVYHISYHLTKGVPWHDIP